MRVLLLNLGAEAHGAVSAALSAEGYEIATEHGLTVDQVLTLSPEVLVTEATPSDLSCCGLISQLKSRPDTRPVKTVMVIQGGALERARALDLGADDVISFPFRTLAVEALSGGAVTKRRFWLIAAIFVLSAAASLAAVYVAVSNHRSRKDALQLKAEIARLNYGLGQQGELFRRADQMRNSLDAQARSDSAARDSLKAKSDDLRKKMAAAPV